VRYEIPDEKGETRRELNARMNVAHTPPFIIPPEAKYIWDWYFSLHEKVARYREGCYHPIPPSEYLAWATLTGIIVYPWEYDIMMAMDAVFCDETNKEIENLRIREREKQQSEAKK